jgi:hypothetical protein
MAPRAMLRASTIAASSGEFACRCSHVGTCAERRPAHIERSALRLRAQTAADPAASLLADYKWRNVGPGSAGGRITDVEALDNDFRFVIAAAASGGVWKSTNAGTTWTPIFDHYGSSSIGDIKIFQQDPSILWVGTGEANNRNSVGGARGNAPPLVAGTYNLKLTFGGLTAIGTLVVRQDPILK